VGVWVWVRCEGWGGICGVGWNGWENGGMGGDGVLNGWEASRTPSTIPFTLQQTQQTHSQSILTQINHTTTVPLLFLVARTLPP
jgi:hypothetical protein